MLVVHRQGHKNRVAAGRHAPGLEADAG
jgi:hypothetical protein